jgi:hypothetical protein
MIKNMSYNICRLFYWAPALLLLLSLSACENTYSLKARIDELEAALQQKTEFIENRQDFLEVMQKEAAVAQACAWVVDICPKSLTAPGQEAIKSGISGGSSTLFWMIVIAKTLAAGTILGSTIAAFRLIQLRIIAPTRQSIEHHQTMIASAKKEAEEILNEAREKADSELANAFATTKDIHNRADQAKKYAGELEERVIELEAHLEALHQQRDEANKSLQSIADARGALDSL